MRKHPQAGHSGSEGLLKDRHPETGRYTVPFDQKRGNVWALSLLAVTVAASIATCLSQ